MQANYIYLRGGDCLEIVDDQLLIDESDGNAFGVFRRHGHTIDTDDEKRAHTSAWIGPSFGALIPSQAIEYFEFPEADVRVALAVAKGQS